MKVEIITQKTFELTTPFTGVKKIKKILLQRQALVVYDKSNYIGIITVKDLAKKQHNLVVDCMVERPNIDFSCEINDALTIMKERDSEVLPVWKNDELLGLVFKNDLLEYLEDQTNELEAKIKERTLELEAALKKVNESDQLKSAFLANLSHEIRTPINGILGFSDLMNKPGLNMAKMKSYAQIINSSSKNLLALLDDLLLMSKLETGQLKFSKNVVNLNALLDEIFCFFKPQTDTVPIKFNLYKGFDDNKSDIIIDDFRLRQVLDNLLINALKFTEQGSIDFGYEVVKDKIRFYVKDTGIGIKSEYHTLIFERFKQVNVDYLKNFKGIGIGLSICKDLVKLMNGEIGVYSEFGKGSEFFFTIPLEKKEVAVEKQTMTNNVDDKSKCNVLIVDDEPNNLILLEEILLMNDSLNIFKAINGKEAVEICQNKNNIDIIFMDIKMPVLNGLEATKIIKKKSPGIAVIAQSAYTSNIHKDKAIEAGCDDFISKPVNMNLLFELIKKYKRV